jgi:hypothetical protein
MSRFDYVKYDEYAIAEQGVAKTVAIELETVINSFKSPRYKALALTKLEETYMYIGKAIRDDQIARNNTTELQEERSNS